MKKKLVLLIALTIFALLVHGYHPAAEDSEIYLPGIEKVLHPNLFPNGAEFFESHAQLTLFPRLIAASVRLTHMPLDWALFSWHMLAIFLLLAACWELSGKLFDSKAGRWSSVAVVACLLTLPVAGTTLYIMDQYLNPRNLTAFALVFAVSSVLDRRYARAGVFLIFSALLHPLMTCFAACFCGMVLWLASQPSLQWSGFASRGARYASAALSFAGETPSAYHRIAASHSYFYLTRWNFFEITGGLLAPLALLFWIWRWSRSNHRRQIAFLSGALLIFGAACTAAGLLLSSSPFFEALGRFQPMRGFYLIYILLLIVAGGLLGEYVLRSHPWRWLALLTFISAPMCAAQLLTFPASSHIEIPGATPANRWEQAFIWVRGHTAPNALFALDPGFMDLYGEDEIGFRAVAERNRMADRVKDSGEVSMFPGLASDWARQTDALANWQHFEISDFEKLRKDFGVGWVIFRHRAPRGLVCPYRNSALDVCAIP